MFICLVLLKGYTVLNLWRHSQSISGQQWGRMHYNLKVLSSQSHGCIYTECVEEKCKMNYPSLIVISIIMCHLDKNSLYFRNLPMIKLLKIKIRSFVATSYHIIYYSQLNSYYHRHSVDMSLVFIRIYVNISTSKVHFV